MIKFKEFINEAKTLGGEDKEFIISLFDSFESKYFKVSNVKVARNVTFQIDFINKKFIMLPKKEIKKNDLLSKLVSKELSKIGMIISPSSVKYKDNKSEITSVTDYNHNYGRVSHHYIAEGSKISVIVTTPKENLLSPESVKKIERIIDKKITELRNKKDDPKTLIYILSKLFPKLYSNKIVIEKTTFKSLKAGNGSLYSGKGFRLDPDNKFGDINYNPVLYIHYGDNKIHENDVEGPIKKAFIRALDEFYFNTYITIDAQFRPEIANNFSASEHPMIYIAIK